MSYTADRTPAEIEAELYALNELLNQVPSASAFGDVNHEAITAQIRVIQERMNRNSLLTQYEDGDPYILSVALDAFIWLWEDGDLPSEGWTAMLEESMAA